jgi:ribosomal protein S18 acetylase RimI-like enzyme
MDVRRIGPDDWADWRELRHRALAEDREAFAASVTGWTGERDSEPQWRERLAGSPACFVAYVDGRPVATVGATPHESSVELVSMWVAPEARGRGVGAALVAAVREHAGARPVRLRVMAGNEPAVTLYARQGFALVPGRPDAEGCRTMVLRPATEEHP